MQIFCLEDIRTACVQSRISYCTVYGICPGRPNKGIGMGKSSLCILLIFLSCSGNQSIKTYEEALQNAMNGVLDQEIIASFRRELINAEISGTVSYLVDVKINLAVSILQLANKVRDPSTYTNMYRESEEILLSALKLHPGHQGGTRNLASVRKNIELRREAHVQERSIPSDFSAFPVQQLTSQPSSTNIDEKIVDDVQSLNYSCMTGNPESFSIVASISTIPPRMDAQLRSAIDALIPQVLPRISFGLAPILCVKYFSGTGERGRAIYANCSRNETGCRCKIQSKCICLFLRLYMHISICLQASPETHISRPLTSLPHRRTRWTTSTSQFPTATTASQTARTPRQCISAMRLTRLT